ncbi:Arc family DNA-binding protein [Kaistia sp. MMO-174]|uniref:Arc family DNA-binding protein n=1 Tax=Kaistia sp. MMO-174 TaxID=3081256 RepID=UPI003FA5EB73
MAAAPSRELDKIMVRLPNGLRTRLAVAAKANYRSVNAEVVSVLQRLYGATEATGEGLDAQIPAASSDTTALHGGASHHQP